MPEVLISTKRREEGEGLVECSEPIKMDADEDREPRSMEEMEKEAEWLRGFFADIERQKERGKA